MLLEKKICFANSITLSQSIHNLENIIPELLNCCSTPDTFILKDIIEGFLLLGDFCDGEAFCHVYGQACVLGAGCITESSR